MKMLFSGEFYQQAENHSVAFLREKFFQVKCILTNTDRFELLLNSP